MVEPAGPFKIILSELPPRASDDLGNPASEQIQIELSRLLDLDEGMAASIAGAMPIVILHGLSARQAGVARERLQVIVQLGCKVITTDDDSDTLPHVNWPVLPPIAQLDESSESRPAARAEPAPTPAPAPGTLTCPSCNASFSLAPLNGLGDYGSAAHAHAAPQGHAPPADRSETRSTNRRFQHEGTLASSRPSEEVSSLDGGLQRETFGGSPGGPPEEIEDDWMSPPVTRVPTPETTQQPISVPDLREDEDDIVPGGTARFNEAALLAYRQADQAPPPAEQTLPPPPPPPQPLPVSFGDSELNLGSHSASHSGLTDFAPPPADASSFEATGSLHDSGSDILDLDPPHRGRDLVESGADALSSRSSGDFQDDFDLLGDDPESEEVRTPTLESLDELEESAPVHASVGSSSRPHEPDPFPEDDPFSDDEFGRMLQSDESPRHAAPAAAAPEGDLDAVLSLFGPEDEEPLDDMAGLQPAPLDLSAKGAGRRRNLMGSEFPSDILEPLNPSEAMEIIKSQKTRGAPRGARLASDDDFDLFGDSGSTAAAPRAQGRKSKKKTRGVPFSASGEDLDLFEDNPRPARSRSKSRSRGAGGGGGGGGGADPFARARQAMDEERSASAAPPPAAKKRREGGRSSSRRSRDRGRSPATRGGGGGGGGGGGPAPKGAGDHGLVLSRISDPDKKERAAELIAEIKGCTLDDASRLTERTIIPVLKGVSRDVAEFHLDKFRRYKIAGRVTTRQRS